MKIHPDQLKALEQEQAKAKAAQKADKGFGDLLAKEVGAPAQDQKAQGAAPPLGGTALSGNILAAQAAAAGQPSESGREVMERLENLMGDWETYSSHVGSAGGQGLREANDALEAIEHEVAELKTKVSSVKDQGGELEAVVNEVEILAVTERIKFNRGDYIE